MKLDRSLDLQKRMKNTRLDRYIYCLIWIYLKLLNLKIVRMINKVIKNQMHYSLLKAKITFI